MRSLTLVFPVYKEEDTYFVLMGKQATGKKMPGVRNGFGGKCEDGESPEDCAVREMKEEIDTDVRKDDLTYIGKIIMGEKLVYVYTTRLSSKIWITDNDEVLDCRWFDVERREEYIHEMLPGDDLLMIEVARSLKTPTDFREFTLDFSHNESLKEMTKNIFR